MRTAKVSTKRVLGLAMAAALAVGATVAVAGSSQAITNPSAAISPKSGPALSTTQVVSITGKGFKSGATIKANDVEFSTTTCGTPGATNATAFNVASDKLITATTPSLAGAAAGTTYYVCVYNTSAVLGEGKYVVYTAMGTPTITEATATVVPASTFGGSTISVVGTNFTKAAKVTVDGVAAKTTYVDTTDLTAIVPPHAASTGNLIKVTDVAGTVTSTDKVSYLSSIKVSPSTATGVSGDVITVTGQGFNNLTLKSWVTTVPGTSVYLVKAGSTITGTTTGAPTGAIACTSWMLLSDTQFTCKPASVPANGAWTVVLWTTDGADATVASSTTGYSTAATYTVAAY